MNQSAALNDYTLVHMRTFFWEKGINSLFPRAPGVSDDLHTVQYTSNSIETIDITRGKVAQSSFRGCTP